MIWNDNDMKQCEMIMIMIWYETIWNDNDYDYDMIWYDMKQCEIIWTSNS